MNKPELKRNEPLYRYTLERTSGSTGFVSCLPDPEPALEDALAQLATRPRDAFLRSFLLARFVEADASIVMSLARRCLEDSADKNGMGPLASLLVEYCGVCGKNIFGEDMGRIENLARSFLGKPAAPAYRQSATPGQAERAGWLDFFRQNIRRHVTRENLPVSPFHTPDDLRRELARLASLTGLLERERAKMEPPASEDRVDPRITWGAATKALERANLLAGPEMRHEASLSPIALLRDWRLDILVKNGSASHKLQGVATAYGRGLSLAGARAACAMEIVERASAHASVAEGGRWGAGRVAGRKADMSLRLATYENLRECGLNALDPASLGSGVHGRRAWLHWVEGSDCNGSPVLVPCQAVFLFCNLDEPQLFDTDSTGLGAGNTRAEARLAALCEVLERDAHATTPFMEEKCFQLFSGDARINSLLLDYRAERVPP